MAWKRHKLHAIKEAEADLRTSQIYFEIKEALGTPHVNTMFQVLASFPEYFSRFWERARPVVEMQEFFSTAGRLRAEAYTRMHNYFAVPDLRRRTQELSFSAGAVDELQQVVDLYYANYPALLLLCAAQAQAFENPETTVPRESRPAEHDWSSVSRVQRPIQVEEESAPPATRRVYDDIKRTMGTPFLGTCYLSLGRWPEFLEEYWTALKPVVATARFEQNCAALRESALALAAELPHTLQLSMTELEEAGIGRDDVSTIVQSVGSFLELLSKQTLNLAFAKIGLEGGVRPAVAA
ncbi:MAG TPA: halocarboxylic acid dehydrogenase DehI family protein [Candidatus Angelobacter sp.]